VYKLVIRGMKNKEIRAALNLSKRTVKFHVSAMLVKFGVDRRFKLIALQSAAPLPASDAVGKGAA